LTAGMTKICLVDLYKIPRSGSVQTLIKRFQEHPNFMFITVFETWEKCQYTYRIVKFGVVRETIVYCLNTIHMDAHLYLLQPRLAKAVKEVFDIIGRDSSESFF
jgi:hypothetical protein